MGLKADLLFTNFDACILQLCSHSQISQKLVMNANTDQKISYM